METERRFEIELPDSGRIVWRFQGDVPVSRLKTLRRLIKPSAVAPASPVATEVSVRRRPFTEREEFGTIPSRTILRTHRLSARMTAADRVEILLHETGDETLLRELYTLQRIIWYGFLPLLLRRKLLLLALDGRGVLLCGSSGSGKSTCARRVPAPWRALADDAVLVSAAEDGIYAQGLPTWSRLLPGRHRPAALHAPRRILEGTGRAALRRSAHSKKRDGGLIRRQLTLNSAHISSNRARGAGPNFSIECRIRSSGFSRRSPDFEKNLSARQISFSSGVSGR